MAFERRDYSGGAVPTTITATITALSTSWAIDDPTGWPQGTNGPFYAVINRKYGGSNLDGTSPEEKILCASLVGNTITLADSSDRGRDGTSAQAWAAPVSIEHCLTATDIDEANLTVSQTVGQVQSKGDALTGKSANRLQRTAAGSNGSFYICDDSQPGGMRFSGIPDGAINSAAQFADNLIPPQKLAGLVMTAVQIDALTGDDLFTGHQVYQQDTSLLRPWPGLYIYNGIGWTPPWNTAWGRIGGAVATSGVAGIGALHTFTAMATDLTLVANRQIEAKLTFTYSQNSSGQPIFYVNDGTTNHVAFEITNGAGEGGRDSGSYDFVSAAGDVTLTPVVFSTPGSVDLFASSSQPFRLDVYDRGPAGNPA